MLTNKLFAFTGLMFSGKDHVADQAGLTKLSMSEPITELAAALTGYTRHTGANVPGMRRLWQQIGQFGWNSVSEQYPITMERCVFVKMVRDNAHNLVPRYAQINWQEYGQRKDFWMNILLQDLKQRLAMSIKDYTIREFAIVNIRFEHELIPAAEFGFQVFHVACSEETRQERMAAAGYKQKPEEANDASEQLAPAVQAVIDDDHVVWNDHRPMPSGKHYWTLQGFLNYVHEGEDYAYTDCRDMYKYRLHSVNGELQCIAQ